MLEHATATATLQEAGLSLSFPATFPGFLSSSDSDPNTHPPTSHVLLYLGLPNRLHFKDLQIGDSCLPLPGGNCPFPFTQPPSVSQSHHAPPCPTTPLLPFHLHCARNPIAHGLSLETACCRAGTRASPHSFIDGAQGSVAPYRLTGSEELMVSPFLCATLHPIQHGDQFLRPKETRQYQATKGTRTYIETGDTNY